MNFVIIITHYEFLERKNMQFLKNSCIIILLFYFFICSLHSQEEPIQTTEAKQKELSKKEKKLQDNFQKFTGLDFLQTQDLPIFLVAGSLEFQDSEDGTKIWIATEGVHLWQGEEVNPNTEMFCEQAVIWFQVAEGESQEKPAHALVNQNKAKKTMFYAEGHVHFRWLDNFFRGEAIFFDLVNNKGLISKGNLRSKNKIGEQLIPLQLRAEKIRILSDDKMIAENASFSTCRFGEPHYHFDSNKIVVRKMEEKIFVQARENTMWALGLPIFTMPYITGETIENWPLKKIEYGDSSRWGSYLLTTWGTRLYRGGENDIIKKADWTIDLDTREKRGLAVGPGFTYSGSLLSTDSFSGKVYGYYVHDQPLSHLGESMDHVPDKDEKATWDKRHRMYFLHRHTFENGWSFDAEYSLLNDKDFLIDFFEKEAREEKEPETYAYVKKQGVLLDEIDAFTFLARGRINNFQSQIEYLPQATYQLIFLPILSNHIDNLYFSSTFETSYVRRKDAIHEETEWDDRDLMRLDWNNSLYYKFSLGPIHFMPYLGARLSYFEDGQEDEKNLVRFVGETGIELSTNFYRYYHAHSDLFQINDILHVFTPQFKYRWIYETNVDSDELIPMDSMESVDEMQLIQLVFNNRLRTVRNGNVTDFFLFDAIFSYYPERDLPKNTVTRLKLPISDRWEKYDNLKLDIWWKIRDNLWIRSKPEYNFQLREIEKVNTSIGYRFNDRFSVSFDHRYRRDDTDLFTTHLMYMFNEKWSFRIDFQYELKDFDLRECDFTIRRIFHRFALDVTLKIDEVGDDTSATVNFYPIDLLKDSPELHSENNLDW